MNTGAVAGLPSNVVFLRVVRHPGPCLICGYVVDGRSRAGGYWTRGGGLTHTACAPRAWVLPPGSCLECGNAPGPHTLRCSQRVAVSNLKLESHS